MRRLLVVLAVALMVSSAAAIALADEHDNGHEFPEHPHILVQRPVIDLYDFPGDEMGPVPAVIDVRKCVDLAGNNSLPLGSQHHNVHFGNAGEKLFEKAGHVVAPAAPFPGVPRRTATTSWGCCRSRFRRSGT